MAESGALLKTSIRCFFFRSRRRRTSAKPLAVLVQESSLGKIGIQDRDQTGAGRQLAQRDGRSKSIRYGLNSSPAGRLSGARFYFFCAIQARTRSSNTSSYDKPGLMEITHSTAAHEPLAAIGDKEKYYKTVEGSSPRPKMRRSRIPAVPAVLTFANGDAEEDLRVRLWFTGSRLPLNRQGLTVRIAPAATCLGAATRIVSTMSRIGIFGADRPCWTIVKRLVDVITDLIGVVIVTFC